MTTPEIFLDALPIVGAIIIVAITAATSSNVEFSAGKGGFKFRLDSRKAPESPKIDQAEYEDGRSLPPSLETLHFPQNHPVQTPTAAGDDSNQ